MLFIIVHCVKYDVATVIGDEHGHIGDAHDECSFVFLRKFPLCVYKLSNLPLVRLLFLSVPDPFISGAQIICMNAFTEYAQSFEPVTVKSDY